jgi:phosphotransacetylase
MPLASFDQLYQEAGASRIPVAVAGAADATVIDALNEANDRGWVEPFLVGNQEEICRTAESVGKDLKGCHVVDSSEPAKAAVELVRSGRALLLMKGQIATPALMAAVLHPVTGLRSGRAICQVVLMEIRPSVRRFLLADTGICIQPSLPQKIDIMEQAVDVARALGAKEPRIALIAATESVSDKMPETIDAAELQRRNRAGEFPDCVIQGPLSFDLAYAADAGDKKRLGGAVVGAADVMVFPDLLSANLTVKAIMYTADCRFGGILCGTTHPVVFMSRADSSQTRLNSLAYALKWLGSVRRSRQGPCE